MSSTDPTASALPARYRTYWGTEFWQVVDGALRSGAAVLDIGAGRKPTISPPRRPAGSHYVGLDISGEELREAPAGAYDEIVVADVQRLVPELIDRFDLIVTWQAMEHVRDLEAAIDNVRSYARGGGWFVACLSGRHAVFAIANRMLPKRVSRTLVARLRRRPPETVFPAYYDRCDERGLRALFSGWEEVRIIPLWHGADYFSRLPRLRAVYLRYEDWAIKRGLTNLATHYAVAARRPAGG
jgi:SAM-dependent methyltransferase